VTFEEMVEKAESGVEYDSHAAGDVVKVWYEEDEEKYIVAYVDGEAESVQIVGYESVTYGGEV